MGKFIPVEPEKWAEMVKAQAEVARLEAEVERLTKAGDDLALWLGFEDEDSPRIKEWEDAKKGGQP